MGSLDSPFLQNPFQDFPQVSLENASYSSYPDYLPLAPPVDHTYHPQAYNPFVAVYAPDQGHHAPAVVARYNPLSQSVPIFPSVCYGDSSLDRPGTPASRGYNPFLQDYELQEQDVGSTHEQFLPTCPYNYIPNRAFTPPHVREYAQAPVHQLPIQQELDAFRSCAPLPATQDAVVPFSSSDAGNSQRLLWLSEEEAEIIRLIRLSQMKENLRSSGLSLCENQATPIPSPKLAPECCETGGQMDEKAALAQPNTSVEELVLPKAFVPKPSIKRDVTNVDHKAPAQDKDTSHEKIDTTKIVDDDREWIAMQRQKIKDITARKGQNAAECIQRHWRQHHSNVFRRQKSMKKTSSIREKPIAKQINNERRLKTGKRKPPSVLEAAKTIQRAWQAFLKRRRKLRTKTRETLPTTLKELYGVIKRRYGSKGFSPPSYGRFVRILERIHACTEGARIRKRLKTRRLQAIVKEIKEIRFLLEDMLQEKAPGSTELVSQLSGQLQQKIIQLHTALQGPGDAARYLLRRGPATPLIIYGSRSTSPTLSLQKSGEQAQIRVIANSHTENGVPSLRCSLFTINKSTDKVSDGLQGKQKIHKDRRDSDNAVKPTNKPASFTEEVHEGQVKVEEQDRSGIRKNANYYLTETNLESQLQMSKADTDNAVASRLSQYLITRGKQPDDRGYESSIKAESDVEQSDHERPKRPFLRRKSMAMAPQKLDWSKVKPMVSSRLEPELKTKLNKSKAKEIARNATSKKLNYKNVKSRLFNYETISAVDTSGALSTERSIEADYVEGVVKHSYAEIHTQGDMSVQEDYWRPVSADSGTISISATEALDCRVASAVLPPKSLSPKQPLSPKPPPKVPSYRYGKSARDIEPRCQPEGSALEEIDHNGELERKKQGHSFRYKEMGTVAPETCAEGRESFVKQTAAAKHDSGDQQKPAACAANATDDRNSQNEVLFASPELEATFRQVLKMKNDRRMSVAQLFEAQEGKTIIPRLSPDASVFTCSFFEKRKLHELLIQEGRASKLQHDALAFVSIRD